MIKYNTISINKDVNLQHNDHEIIVDITMSSYYPQILKEMAFPYLHCFHNAFNALVYCSNAPMMDSILQLLEKYILLVF